MKKGKVELVSEIKDLKPNQRNPRKISEQQLSALEKAMEKFGDLGCVVFNITTKRMVGGHQRVKVLNGKDTSIHILERFDKPNEQGTVAWGAIKYGNELYKYREVKWSEQDEQVAMLAANKHGGEWDLEKLKEGLLEMDDGSLDMDLTGFMDKEIEKLMGENRPVLNLPQAQEAAEKGNPLTAEQMKSMPSHVKMVQLFFNTETQPIFLALCSKLQERYGTDNVTDTVMQAVRQAASINEN